MEMQIKTELKEGQQGEPIRDDAGKQRCEQQQHNEIRPETKQPTSRRIRGKNSRSNSSLGGGNTYVASMTTPTPVGCRASVMATAICLVNLS